MTVVPLFPLTCLTNEKKKKQSKKKKKGEKIQKRDTVLRYAGNFFTNEMEEEERFYDEKYESTRSIYTDLDGVSE